MSYCVNCGVELADYIKKCPLCSTEVINPNEPYDFASETPYPEYQPVNIQKISPKVILGIIAIIFMLPIAICVIADFSLNGILDWSGYVVSSLFAVYTVLASSLLVHKESMILEQMFDYMAILLLIVYIETQSGGEWLLTFAIPLLVFIVFSTILITVVAKISARSALTPTALSLILIGLFTILIDLLVNYNFFGKISVHWSLYSFITLVIIGTVLLFIDNNKPLKRRLEKKFFI